MIQVTRMWSRNRDALNDFVCAAREFYINSPLPPRKADPDEDKVYTLSVSRRASHLLRSPSQSGSLIKANFQQGDWSYDWILAYLVCAIMYCHRRDSFLTAVFICPLSAPRMSSTMWRNFQSPRNNRMLVGALVQKTPCDSDLRKMFSKCFNIIQHEREERRGCKCRSPTAMPNTTH